MATALIRDPVKYAYWKERVREDFLAKTASGSKNSKRKTVEILAMEVIRAENLQFAEIYPLTPGLMIGVSAALKGAGYRAADQYLEELRLGHIESELPIPEHISQCSRTAGAASCEDWEHPRGQLLASLDEVADFARG